jgi:hypothetical protein
MAAIGFAGELTLAGVFWISHLAMSLITRKYRKTKSKRVISNNPPELPASGQILVMGIDGQLTSVPNDMAIICSDYGSGDIVYQVSGGSILMGPNGYGENSFLNAIPSSTTLDITLLDEYCPLDKEQIGIDLLDEYCPLDKEQIGIELLDEYCPLDKEQIGIDLLDEYCPLDKEQIGIELLDKPPVDKEQVVTETPVDNIIIVDETLEVDSDDEQYHSLMNLSSLQ